MECYIVNYQAFLLVGLCLLLKQGLCERTARDAVTLMEDVLNRSDSRIRPSVYDGPVDVKIDFYIRSYGPLNEVDMDVGVDVYFRQRWVDDRLTFHPSRGDHVTIPARHAHTVWEPDLYFPNEKKATVHDVTARNQILKVYPNGTVWTSMRITMRMACNMWLMYFPLDYQDCAVQISSFSYDLSEVRLGWLDDSPVEMKGKDLSLRQFQLLEITTHECKSTFKTGDYPCLEAVFHLQREFSFYILQTYIPSILIVSLSWVSFWINVEAIPGRVSLGVTTVLTMTTQMSASRTNVIPVSYPKAIDVWYAVCMIFVFGGFLEYSFAHVLNRQHTKKQNREKESPSHNNQNKEKDANMEMNQVEVAGRDAVHQNPNYELDPMVEKGRSVTQARSPCTYCGLDSDNLCAWPFSGPDWSPNRLDKLSRVLFPTCFFLFNVVYWSVYAQPGVSHMLVNDEFIPDGNGNGD